MRTVGPTDFGCASDLLLPLLWTLPPAGKVTDAWLSHFVTLSDSEPSPPGWKCQCARVKAQMNHCGLDEAPYQTTETMRHIHASCEGENMGGCAPIGAFPKNYTPTLRDRCVKSGRCAVPPPEPHRSVTRRAHVSKSRVRPRSEPHLPQ